MHRYANRIPLLFEGGSDVITKTALRRINWSAYKINQATDKVCVWKGGEVPFGIFSKKSHEGA